MDRYLNVSLLLAWWLISVFYCIYCSNWSIIKQVTGINSDICIEILNTWYILSSMCLRLCQFSQLFFMQYMGLIVFSLHIPLVLIVRIHVFFSCDQAALWMVQSVCPSVRLSVCLSVCLSVTPFWLCYHHRIIMKFPAVITKDQGKVHAKGQGQRSKVKVTEVTTQLNRFRTVTPVWIHKWWWNDAYTLIMLRRGALLFFKVIRQISRSHGSKNRWIWPRLGVSGL